MFPPRAPTSTYRLQFHGGFTFDDALAIVPFLDALGVTDVYASPLLAARMGSGHGYDVTDPRQVNSALGGRDGLARFARALQERGMGLLLDIVPNHMAASVQNPWWNDVLEHGRASSYADVFDIDWDSGGGRVLLPVLGDLYGATLERGEIGLGIDEEGLHLRYFEQRFPIDPRSYPLVLARLSADARMPDGVRRGLDAIAARAAGLPPFWDASPADRERRRADATVLKRDLRDLLGAPPDTLQAVVQALRRLNGRVGDPESFDLLDAVLQTQPYRLAHWRLASANLNYRRFFAINDLVGVRVEDAPVFEATHQRILDLVAGGEVTGLRIDHIDGLREPLPYLQRLQADISERLSSAPDGLRRERFYVLVEKILGRGETLRDAWPVAGTTGYDFLNEVNGLFVDPAGLRRLIGLYEALTGSTKTFQEVAASQKRAVLDVMFAGEMWSLTDKLVALAQGDRHARDLSRAALADSLAALTSSLPVYRTYLTDASTSPEDRAVIEAALATAAKARPDIHPEAFRFLSRVLALQTPVAPDQPGARSADIFDFVLRWQQLTGPVMAKGLEDAALYLHNPLISLNDVGGGPESLPLAGDTDAFHRANLRRRRDWPETMNATATHDTKRGEDVRARASVLSELPHEWRRRLASWRRMNEDKRVVVRGRPVPTGNEESLLYQSLVAGWPLSRLETDGPFTKRFKDFMIKAVREGGAHTSWTAPDDAYESALLAFIDAILAPTSENAFLANFLPFQDRIAHHGFLNSLAQLVLKMASPGVPDTYQGTELWDLSFVDPDNRRPVDFAARSALLAQLPPSGQTPSPRTLRGLLAQWRDGGIKLYVTASLLRFRRERPALFRQGDYRPLIAVGARERNVVSFARIDGKEWVVAAVPRFTTQLVRGRGAPLGRRVWRQTLLPVPFDAPRRWRHVLTGARFDVAPSPDGGAIMLADAFRRLPVALLHGRSD